MTVSSAFILYLFADVILLCKEITVNGRLLRFTILLLKDVIVVRIYSGIDVLLRIAPS